MNRDIMELRIAEAIGEQRWDKIQDYFTFLLDENEALRARKKELLTLLAQGYELVVGEALGDAS